MFAKKLQFWLFCLFSVGALAQTPNTVIESGDNRIEVLGSHFAKLAAVSSHQSRIVLYSPAENSLPGATSLFVNGTYHASLIKGAWTDLCYRPGSVEFGARQMEVGQRAKDSYDTISALTLVGGRAHYLRVIEQNGRPILQPVSAALAERELPSKRLQLHTISRVAQDCVEAAEPAPAVAEPGRYTLDDDTLFAFARSDRQSMTRAGMGAVELLLSRLRNDFSRIERLHIIGHADPLGAPAVNNRLSLERANTVRSYIDGSKQLNAPISVEGRGAREPVVVHCSRVDTPQARECNQPNRRVVVEVTGTRR